MTWDEWFDQKCDRKKEVENMAITLKDEYVSFGDEYAIIDKKVIAWREIEEFVYQEKNIPEEYNENIMKRFAEVK